VPRVGSFLAPRSDHSKPSAVAHPRPPKSEPCFQRPHTSGNLVERRIKLHEGAFDSGVPCVTLNTASDPVSRQWLRRFFELLCPPKSKNAQPSLNRASFTSASSMTRLVRKRPARLIETSLSALRNSRIKKDKDRLVRPYSSLQETPIGNRIYKNVLKKLWPWE